MIDSILKPKIVIVDYRPDSRKQVCEVLNSWLSEDQYCVAEYAQNLDLKLMDLSCCALFSCHKTELGYIDRGRKNQEADAQLALRKSVTIGCRMQHSTSSIPFRINESQRDGSFSFDHLLRLLRRWRESGQVPAPENTTRAIIIFFCDQSAVLLKLLPLRWLVEGAIIAIEANISLPDDWFYEREEEMKDLLARGEDATAFEHAHLQGLDIPLRMACKAILFPEGLPSHLMELARAISKGVAGRGQTQRYLQTRSFLEQAHDAFQKLDENYAYRRDSL